MTESSKMCVRVSVVPSLLEIFFFTYSGTLKTHHLVGGVVGSRAGTRVDQDQFHGSDLPGCQEDPPNAGLEGHLVGKAVACVMVPTVLLENQIKTSSK